VNSLFQERTLVTIITITQLASARCGLLLQIEYCGQSVHVSVSVHWLTS